MSFVRQQSQGNLYCEFCETAATEEPCIVIIVRQLLQRNLFCEFCEKAAIVEPLFIVL